MSKLTEYKQQIQLQLDQLQAQLESNSHLRDPHTAAALLSKLSLRWHFLSDQDRDYVQAAQTAVQEQQEWNVNP